MNLAITLEYRFSKTPNGSIWTKTTYSSSFWDSYLNVFDKIKIIARAEEVCFIDSDYKRVDSSNRIEVICLPLYIGPLQYLQNFIEIRKILTREVSNKDAVIMRVGSPIADILQKILKKRKQPYGVEVVGDPWDVFASSAFHHPFRLFFRYYFRNKLRKQCKNADAALYVTAHTLQNKYPVDKNKFFTGVSDIELDEQDLLEKPRSFNRDGDIFKLIFIGSLEYYAKAPDILIEAVALNIKKGFKLCLTIVGDGRIRENIEKSTRKLNIKEYVNFLGQLPAGESIKRQLDEHDIFILPSRTEGLPRALIEAMARALPCIGSDVGGIPELLEDEDMVKPGDAVALAQKIEEFLFSPTRMNAASKRNLEKSKEYLFPIIIERKKKFINKVKDNQTKWLSGKSE